MSNFPGLKGPSMSNFPGVKGPSMSNFPGFGHFLTAAPPPIRNLASRRLLAPSASRIPPVWPLRLMAPSASRIPPVWPLRPMPPSASRIPPVWPLRLLAPSASRIPPVLPLRLMPPVCNVFLSVFLNVFLCNFLRIFCCVWATLLPYCARNATFAKLCETLRIPSCVPRRSLGTSVPRQTPRDGEK